MDSVAYDFCSKVIQSLTVRNMGAERLSGLRAKFWSTSASRETRKVKSFNVAFYVDTRNDSWHCEIKRKEEGESRVISSEEFLGIPREQRRFEKIVLEDKSEFVQYALHSYEDVILPILNSLAQQRSVRKLRLDSSKPETTEMFCEKLHEKTYFSSVEVRADSDESSAFRKIFFDFVRDQSKRGLCKQFILAGSWPLEILPWVQSTLQSRNVSFVISHPKVDCVVFEQLLDWWRKTENPRKLKIRLDANATFDPKRHPHLKPFKLTETRTYQVFGLRHPLDPDACAYAYIVHRGNWNVDLIFDRIENVPRAIRKCLQK